MRTSRKSLAAAGAKASEKRRFTGISNRYTRGNKNRRKPLQTKAGEILIGTDLHFFQGLLQRFLGRLQPLISRLRFRAAGFHVPVPFPLPRPQLPARSFRHHRPGESLRGLKSAQGPTPAVGARQNFPFAGSQRDAETVERNSQAFAARFDVRLLARPAEKKSFRPQSLRKRLQFCNFFHREKSLGDVVHREIRSDRFEIDAHFALQRERVNRQSVRVRKVEANRSTGIGAAQLSAFPARRKRNRPTADLAQDSFRATPAGSHGQR